MNFIVSSSQLLKHLQLLSGVISTNNSIPILDNFLFELSDDKLKISASDLETTISANLEIEYTGTASIAVPSRILLDTLKTLPSQPLTFKIKENKEIKISSENGNYKMSYFAGDEFPKVTSIEHPVEIAIASDILAKAIHKTIFATGNDDLRPIMNGVLFEFGTKGMNFVATDAHKLVKFFRKDIISNEETQFITPKKPLHILKGILTMSNTDVTISYNASNARFAFDNIILTCRLIDGKYPNYNAVIPEENPNKLIISRNAFLNSTKRVSIFSSKTTHQIRLKMAGTELHLSAEDLDFSNKAEERIHCDYQGNDLEIGFNSRFLIEMLSNLESENIQLEMSSANKAGVLSPVDHIDENEEIMMLVMPISLNS